MTNTGSSTLNALQHTATPLHENVRQAVENYFSHLDGHQANNLYDIVLEQVVRPLLETVLKQTGGNRSKAAQILGISRGTLLKRLEEYQIN